MKEKTRKIFSTNLIPLQLCFDDESETPPPPLKKKQKKRMTSGWEGIISTSFFPTAFTIFNTSSPAKTLSQIPYPNLFLACSITPDGKKIYVADRSVATVTVVDAKTYAILKTISIPSAPGSVDIILSPPAFQRAYVSNQTTGILTVLSTATDTVLGSVNLGGILSRLANTPDGSRLFVGQTVGGLVMILDALTTPNTPSLLVSIPVGGDSRNDLDHSRW